MKICNNLFELCLTSLVSFILDLAMLNAIIKTKMKQARKIIRLIHLVWLYVKKVAKCNMLFVIEKMIFNGG